MGVTEETGKVATSVVEGLKAQPIILALIVMNVVFIIFVGWLLHTLNQRTIHQYEVKDEQTATLLTKLDTIAEVKSEVSKIAERMVGAGIALKAVTDTVDRLGKGLEDHEKRIRELELRK
jgi:hypothetical protein